MGVFLFGVMKTVGVGQGAVGLVMAWEGTVCGAAVLLLGTAGFRCRFAKNFRARVKLV